MAIGVVLDDSSSSKPSALAFYPVLSVRGDVSFIQTVASYPEHEN